MRFLAEVRERIAALFTGAREDAALREELEFHIEMETRANLSRGMDPTAARRAARHTFGSAERFTEETRDERGASGVLDFIRDLRFGIRALARSRVFAVVVVSALAIGIGSTTAVFGLLNAVLLRPLPGVADAHELVLIQAQKEGGNSTGISIPNFTDLSDGAPAFASMAGYTGVTLHASGEGWAPFVMRGEAVLGDYFGTLGVKPAVGRFFTADEVGPGADGRVIVLSMETAKRLYPDGGAVGRTLRANGEVFTIIGVAPAGFNGVERLSDVEAWVPPAAYLLLRHVPWSLSNRDLGLFQQFMGRLRENSTPEVAQQQLRARMAVLVSEYPDANAIYEDYPPTVVGALGIRPNQREAVASMLKLLFGVSILVLVIACANVANLLVFRGVVRRGEAAVRRALGASMPRLLQQNLAEGLVIAFLGATGGLVAAVGFTKLLTAESPYWAGMQEQSLLVDWRLLGFTTAIAFAVSLLFAAVPSVMTRRLDLSIALKTNSRVETGRIGLVRGGLVVLQLGASVSLLIVSLLLTRTVDSLSRIELGFDPERLVAFGISTEEHGYDLQRRLQLQQDLMADVRSIAGVDEVAVTASLPFGGVSTLGGARSHLWPEGRKPLRVSAAWASPSHFATLGVPLVAGRGFTPQEAADSSARVVVLNRTAAMKLFGSTDVIGRNLTGGWSSRDENVIVGVVEDIRHGNLREPIMPMTYHPIATYPFDHFFVLVRSGIPLSALEPQVQEIMTRLDPEVPFFRVNLLTESVRNSMARERFLGRVTTLLAALAGLLAALGLYGLLAYTVAQRTREIGIRLALGAQPWSLVAWVTGRMLVLAAVGVLTGVLGGLLLAEVVQSQLYGVEAIDPRIYGVAAIILLTVSAVAAALPARAAAAVQPRVALQSE